MKTLNSPFFIDMQRGAQEAAKRLDVDLVVQAAEREIDVEQADADHREPDPDRVSALARHAQRIARDRARRSRKANAADIPVVIVDTRVDPKAAADSRLKIVSFIGSDNYEGGQIDRRVPGESVGRQGQGRDPRGDSRARDRRLALRGFRDADQGQRRASTIVASQTANWERDQGFTVFQNMLQAHPRHRQRCSPATT